MNKNYFIYILSNPAFPGWLKIGRTCNIKRRLDGYNVCSPYRDFKIDFYCYAKNIIKQERYFKKNFESNGEWIRCELDTAVKVIKLIEDMENIEN